MGSVPEERLMEWSKGFRPSLRDGGRFLRLNPTLKHWAILTKSLRDKSILHFRTGLPG